MPPFPRLACTTSGIVDDCRSLREMDVVVRAWHWGVTFATAKKLPSLAAETAAILVRRIAEARNGPREIY